MMHGSCTRCRNHATEVIAIQSKPSTAMSFIADITTQQIPRESQLVCVKCLTDDEIVDRLLPVLQYVLSVSLYVIDRSSRRDRDLGVPVPTDLQRSLEHVKAWVQNKRGYDGRLGAERDIAAQAVMLLAREV